MNKPAAMKSLLTEVQAVRIATPSWSFEQSWNQAIAMHPELVTSRAESKRVAAKLAPQKEIESRERFSKIESMARRLMARNRKLTFGVALTFRRNCLPLG